MYLDEFYINQKFYLEPIKLSLEEIKEFAIKYDPLPLHLDENLLNQVGLKG
ncbi:hypothetical protein GOQ27_13020 [Clostridium sp. D2Q-11]|uniref:MaoC-like domain-containing protein n=1 Tax=Anaeromonas frigoriresistens TaxID=2683708 RepID=A0A942Z7B7_9FIRM|nr:hypothetical protein [Anaeromonas frigoriresistens]MBS4539391.1 hypothetical protein [Anaeromonas frigoriresistens]